MDVTSLNFTPEIIFAFGICFVLIVILYLKLFSVRKKISKLINKYNNFMGGLGEKNIEQLLETCLDRVNQVGIKNREIETEINSIERNLIQCIQKIGIIYILDSILKRSS
jgi:predicted PurR-regulated permease PerM